MTYRVLGAAVFVLAAAGIGIGALLLVRALDHDPPASVLAVLGAVTVLALVLSGAWRWRPVRRLVAYSADEPPDPRYTLEPMDRAGASAAFRAFFHHYFVDRILLLRNEVDFAFLRRLRPDEVELARRLVRANLARGTHFVEGAALLGDHAATAELRRMLDQERQLAGKLPIARALWCLERDPAFPELLFRLARSTDTRLKLDCVPDAVLLGRERAIDLLFDLVGDRDETVRQAAAEELDDLLHRSVVGFLVRPWRRRRDAAYFQRRSGDQAFRAGLAARVPHVRT
jgi:hypothetical protein